MPRLHLFEIEDQPWCLEVLRDGATAYLELMVRATGTARAMGRELQRALHKSGHRHVTDLCSGGAGPLPTILEELEVTATLTDLYPNEAAFRAAAARNPRIGYRLEPIDCTRLPAELDGHLTLFNALHHLPPALARQLLEEADRRRQPIAAFELVSRHPRNFVGLLLLPLIVLITMLWVRPRRLEWLFFTYVLPLIPLLVLWDGLVSCLRAYSTEELHELTRGLDDFEWEVRDFDLPIGQGKSLLGIPKCQVSTGV